MLEKIALTPTAVFVATFPAPCPTAMPSMVAWLVLTSVLLVRVVPLNVRFDDPDNILEALRY